MTSYHRRSTVYHEQPRWTIVELNESYLPRYLTRMSHRWTLQIDSLVLSGLKIIFFEVASDKVPQENIQ